MDMSTWAHTNAQIRPHKTMANKIRHMTDMAGDHQSDSWLIWPISLVKCFFLSPPKPTPAARLWPNVIDLFGDIKWPRSLDGISSGSLHNDIQVHNENHEATMKKKPTTPKMCINYYLKKRFIRERMMGTTENCSVTDRYFDRVKQSHSNAM